MPRLFQFVPEPTKKWYQKIAPARILARPYRIHLLCECGDEGRWHFTKHKGIKVQQPREFLLKAAPYLKILLRTMAIASRMGATPPHVRLPHRRWHVHLLTWCLCAMMCVCLHARAIDVGCMQAFVLACPYPTRKVPPRLWPKAS